ncbi:hypothetical protein HU200_051180 [Digitaria exilis]|uniref:Uncharacterized protein n=1 Tax=Digitaria exilis TaxID=1010633 RepID=A0A835AQV4_9POAL|nr:hypothetical protein HU200_051180 [Digitaria exilis]
MATNYYEDHSISSSHADDMDERRSTVSVSPEGSADEETFPFFGLLCYADTVDWLLMALGTLGSIIHGIAFPVGYLLLGKALDAFGTNIHDQEGMVHALYKVVPYVWYMAAATLPAGMVEISCWIYSSERQLARMRLAFLRSVLSQEIGAFDTDLTTAAIITGVTNHMSVIQDAIGEKLGHFVASFSTFFAGIIIAFISCWEVAMLSFLVIPLILVIGATYTKKMNVISLARNAIVSEAISVVEQVFAVTKNKATGGGTIAAIMSILFGAISITYAAPDLQTFNQAKAAGKEVFKVIKRKPSISYDKGGAVLEKIHGEIKFRRVHFAYPSRQDKPILQGDVFIDGHSIKKLDLKSLRRNIASVSQEPALFSGNIKDNLRIGKMDANDKEIIEAATTANVHSFISKLPNEYLTENVVTSDNVIEEQVSEAHVRQSSTKQGTKNKLERVESKQHKKEIVREIHPFFRLWYGLHKEEILKILFGSSAAAISGISKPLFGYFIMTIGVAYYDPDAKRKVSKYSLIFFTAGMITLVSNILQHYIYGIIGEKAMKNLREALFSAVLRNELGWFEKPKNGVGSLTSRIVSDTSTVKTIISDRMAVIVQCISSILIATTVSMYVNWRMGLVSWAVMPCHFIGGLIQAKSAKGFYGDSAIAHQELISLASEAAGNIRTVASFVYEDEIIKKAELSLHEPLKKTKIESMKYGVIQGISLCLWNIAHAVALWYTTVLVQRKQASFENSIRSYQIFSLTVPSITELWTLIPMVMSAIAILNPAFDTLDRETQIVPDKPENPSKGWLVGRIEFQDVHFNYPSRPEYQRSVLQFWSYMVVSAHIKTHLYYGSVCLQIFWKITQDSAKAMPLVQEKDRPTESSESNIADSKKSSGPDAMAPETEAEDKPFPFLGLLCYADALDWLLMLIPYMWALAIVTLPGGMIAGATNHMSVIQDAIGEKMGHFISNFSTFLVAIIVAFACCWEVGMLSLLVVPMLLMVGATYAKMMTDMSLARTSFISEATTVVEQTLANIKTVFSFVGENSAIKSFNKCMNNQYTLSKKEAMAKGLGLGMLQIATFCSYSLVIWVGAAAVTGGKAKPGETIAAVINVLSGAIYISNAAPDLQVFSQAKAAGKQIFEVIKRNPAISYESSGKILEKITGDIEMREVYFTYPSREDEPVLQGVVLIDNQNIKELDLKYLRRNIGSVSQEPSLFSGTHEELLEKSSFYSSVCSMQNVEKDSGKSDTRFTGHGKEENKEEAEYRTYNKPSFTSSEQEKKLDPTEQPMQGKVLLGSTAAAISGISRPIFAFYIMTVGMAYLEPDTKRKVIILRNEMGWFEQPKNSVGFLTSRIVGDTSMIKTIISDRMSLIVQCISSILIATALSTAVEWRMGLVAWTLTPLHFIAGLVQVRSAKGFATDFSTSHQKLISLTSEAVSNIRTVASFVQEDEILRKADLSLQEPMRKSKVESIKYGAVQGISLFLWHTTHAIAMSFTIMLLDKGLATFENCVRSYQAFAMTISSITELWSLIPMVLSAIAILEPALDILDRETQIVPDVPKVHSEERLAGDVEFQDVGFSYPSRPEVIILDGFNLAIEAGQRVALVGSSGSGKSTVLALLLRFYDPYEGQVLVDGKDIRHYNLRYLRKHIGLVQQEPILFNMSIRENISYGNEGVSESEIIEAAKEANIHEFISGLSNGYDTVVGDKGSQLSGGQKQRIAIARTILKRPTILLLDEATSALDSESERAVMTSLGAKEWENKGALSSKITSITIAHRISTVTNADVIVVMDKGQVIEMGSHESLLSASTGVYCKLYHMQSKGVKE